MGKLGEELEYKPEWRARLEDNVMTQMYENVSFSPIHDPRIMYFSPQAVDWKQGENWDFVGEEAKAQTPFRFIFRQYE